MAKYLIALLLIVLPHIAEARKVKQSLKIPKEKTSRTKSDKEDLGVEVAANEDSYMALPNGRQVHFCPDSISFAGYEKEANAGFESFIIINNTETSLSGVKMKIIYKDLQDRMLHSRIVEQRCFVPTKESRKIDIKSWDKQHTYFYYLGNEPRKVATPYKIEILPLAFYIKD